MLGNESASDLHGQLFPDPLDDSADRMHRVRVRAVDHEKIPKPAAWGFTVETRGIEPLTPALQKRCSAD